MKFGEPKPAFTAPERRHYTVTFRIERVSFIDKIVEATSASEAKRIASYEGVSPHLYEERDSYMRALEIETVEENT